MTYRLDEKSSEGTARFWISPGDWFRGCRVVAVEREWHSGIVTVEARA